MDSVQVMGRERERAVQLCPGLSSSSKSGLGLISGSGSGEVSALDGRRRNVTERGRSGNGSPCPEG